MKNGGRLGRNSLRGIEGDRTSAILCAVGQNLRLLLRFIVGFFCHFRENHYFFPIFFTFSRASPALTA
jgi:hypothetical protein